MCNLATDLFLHKKLVTTEAKAKELRPFAESLITRARIAYSNEQAGILPESRPNKSGEVVKSTTDFVQRRQVGKFIRNKAVLQELFDTIAPAVAERNGGYTRIVKLGPRRGDGGREAIIELVDFALPQDGVVRRKKKAAAAPRKVTPVEVAAVASLPVAAAAEAPVVEEVSAPEEIIDAVQDAATDVQISDAPAADSTDASADAADGGSAE
jgi:large subunit ribosomal protein L17